MTYYLLFRQKLLDFGEILSKLPHSFAKQYLNRKSTRNKNKSLNSKITFRNKSIDSRKAQRKYTVSL